MKKIGLLLTLLFTLSGCTNSLNKYQISTKENIDSFVLLDNIEFSNLFNSNNDNMFFIGNPTCSSCAIAEPLLKKYIEVTGVIIYWVDSFTFEKVKEDLNIGDIKSSTLLISNTKVVKHQFEFTKKLYSSQSYLNSKLSEMISPSKFKNINDLNEKKYGESWSYFYEYNYSTFDNLEKSISSQKEKSYLRFDEKIVINQDELNNYSKNNFYYFFDPLNITIDNYKDNTTYLENYSLIKI